MNFIVDAQLPRRISHRLHDRGHDAVHTLDLPSGNRSLDATINELSISESRIVITKDTDFVDSLIVSGVPYKLLLVSTGNITNVELERLLLSNLESIIQGFSTYRFIEIDRIALRFHF